MGDDGEMLGVMSIDAALDTAEEQGMDLVEISPNAEPPVCKIMNYGKFKYEQQKKKNEARKKQKVVDIKEVKLRPTIDENDYQVKLRSAFRFIEEGDKVKFTLKFRGREMAHQDIGMRLLERVKTDMAEVSKAELEPRLEGRQMIMILVEQ